MTTCLRRANEAYLRVRDQDRAREDVLELAGFRVFSNRNLQAITGLPEQTIASLTQKKDHTGGRLNAECLPILVRIADDWEAEVLNERLLRLAVDRGTSRAMIAKLTGIPEYTIVKATK